MTAAVLHSSPGERVLKDPRILVSELPGGRFLKILTPEPQPRATESDVGISWDPCLFFFFLVSAQQTAELQTLYRDGLLCALLIPSETRIFGGGKEEGEWVDQ